MNPRDAMRTDDGNLTREVDAVSDRVEQPGTMPGQRIGDYEVLEEIARGGMGVVFKARQVGLGRIVALKMILAGGQAGPADLARFRSEAQTLARLRHVNIVQVHEVNTHEGKPFFSLEFCAGGSLDKKLAGNPLPPPQATALVQTLARAMQAAHDANVVHRDLKPGNILLSSSRDAGSSVQSGGASTQREGGDSGGASALSSEDVALPLSDAIPKITDFGLAKRLDEASQTTTGAVIGTPSYMAPEQAHGNKDVGPSVDIYALGAILYECLTGRPPFKAATAYDTIIQVLNEQPVSPRRLNTHVPRDLETVCLKCLAKDPARRYGSAAELADDLARWQRGEAIRARPVSRLERGWRWCRRNPVPAALTVMLALLLVAATAGSLLWARAARQSADTERELRGDAERAREKEQHLRNDAELAREKERLAHEAAENTITDMFIQNGLIAGERGENDLASLWFAHAARRAAHGSDRQRADRVRAATYGRQAFQPVAALPHSGRDVPHLSFHPAGRFLLTRAITRQGPYWDCTIWDIEHEVSLPLPTGSTFSVGACWSPDGNRLAVGAFAAEVLVCRFPGLEVLQRVPTNGRQAYLLAFSPNGRFLAVGTGQEVRVWDCQDKAYVTPLLKHPGTVENVTFSPGNDRLATGCWDHKARVFAIPSTGAAPIFPPVTHTLRRDFDFGGVPVAPAFAQGGKALLVVEKDSGSNYRDATTGKVLHTLLPLPDTYGNPAATNAQAATNADVSGKPTEFRGIHSLAVSVDGKYLAIATLGKAQLVDVATVGWVGRPMRHQPHQGVSALAFSPDGQTLLTASSDNTLRRWSVPAGEPVGRPLVHPLPVHATAVSADGRYVATSQKGGLVRVWRMPSEALDNFRVPLDGIGSLVKFSPDSRFLLPTGLTFRKNGLRSTHVVPLARDQPNGPNLGQGGIIRDGAFSPDNRLVALVRESPDAVKPPIAGQLELWDWRAGKLLHDPVPVPSEPRAVDYSPDGRLVAVTCAAGRLLLVDPTNGRVVRQWSTHRGIWGNNWYLWNGSVRFTVDGRSLLTWSSMPFVRVWDPETGRERIPPVIHQNVIDEVAVSPDGSVLATAGHDNCVRLWSFATGRPVGEALVHPEWVFMVQFSPDGRLLLTTCRDGAARVWDWRKRQLVCPPLKHNNEVHPAAFLPNGRWVMTASMDRTARIWDVHTGLPATPSLSLASEGLGVAVTPDGKFAAASGFGGAVDVFALHDLNRPDSGTPDDLCLWGEVLAGRRVVDGGGVANLTSAEWLERWQDFRVRGQPNNAQFRIAHARAYVGLQQPDKALVEASKAVELQPREVAFRQSRAEIYMVLRRWDEAIADYTSALGLKPDDPLLHDVRGNLLAFRARWDEAANDFSRLISIGGRSSFWPPWYQPSRHVLALRSAGKMGDYRNACARMLESAKDTTDVQTAIFTAWSCTFAPDAVADLTRPLRLAEKAVAQDAKNPLAHQTVGAVLYRLGRLEECLKHFRTVQTLGNAGGSTSPAYVDFYQAMAHHRLHHPVEARKFLKKAVAQAEREVRGSALNVNPASWVRQATLRLLRAEAESVLANTPTP